VTVSLADRDLLTGYLVALSRSRDRLAFAALFRHFAPRVKTYLIRLGTPAAAAEDLAQETMLSVWRKADQFDPAKAEAATWIFAIARNLRIDAVRRERRPEAPVEVLDCVADDAPPADEVVAAGQREARVRAALASLPPEQAQVVALSYFDDRPHGEIAAALGIPLGTVKSRLRLAMGRVRAFLGHEEQ
jgi:RNA polymerase sigma-70 factor (ECF subfamily)